MLRLTRYSKIPCAIADDCRAVQFCGVMRQELFVCDILVRDIARTRRVPRETELVSYIEELSTPREDVLGSSVSLDRAIAG